MTAEAFGWFVSLTAISIALLAAMWSAFKEVRAERSDTDNEDTRESSTPRV